MEFKWNGAIKLERFGRKTITLPDFRKLHLTKAGVGEKARSVSLPFSISGYFLCSFDRDNDIIKFTVGKSTNKMTYKTRNIEKEGKQNGITVSSNAIRQLNWHDEVEIYRYIVNKDLFFLFRKKDLVIELRKQFEKPIDRDHIKEREYEK
jgi:hypothetical protein